MLKNHTHHWHTTIHIITCIGYSFSKNDCSKVAVIFYQLPAWNHGFAEECIYTYSVALFFLSSATKTFNCINYEI